VRAGDRAQDPLHALGHAGAVGGALEDRGLHAGVADALGDVAGEELGEQLGPVDQLPRPAEPEEHGHVVVGVETGGGEDPHVHLLGHLDDAGGVAPEPEDREVDDRAHPAGGDVLELLDGVRHPLLLVPAAGVVRLDLLVEDEHVLVHEGLAEVVGVDRAEDGFHCGHRRALLS
jgi:hypothetical protein